MESKKRSLQNIADYAAAVLLLLPVLCYLPLSWLRLTGKAIPLYGLLTTFDLSIGAIIGAALCIFKTRYLLAFYQETAGRKLFAASELAILVIALGQQFFFRDNWSNFQFTAFFIFYFNAAAANKECLLRVFPWFSTFTVVLLLISGFTSENFTGMTGNWNWTQLLISALLPWLGTCFRNRKWKMAAAILPLPIFFAILLWIHPEVVSRNAILSALLAGSGLLIFAKYRERLNWKLIALSTITAGIGFFVILRLAEIPVLSADSRWSIWRSTAELIWRNPWFGYGIGRFQEIIPTALSEQYFFTNFPAVNHPHPHNELLHWWFGSGIAGLVFWLALLCHTIPVPDGKINNRTLLLWSFTVLFLSGFWDMLWVIVPGGVLLTVTAGMLTAAPTALPPPCRLQRQILAATGVLLLIDAAGAVMAMTISSSRLRDGELALRLRRDVNSASEHFSESCRRHPNAEAIYRLAEMEALIFNRPQWAIYLLQRMRQEFGLSNFRHSRRIYAVSAANSGDMRTALREIRAEERNCPYSLLAASLHCQIAAAAPGAEAESTQARQYLETLCRLRGIPLNRVAQLTGDEDDDLHPLQESQQ